MPYTITKNLDGDVNLGSMNGEFVTLQPAAADYPAGGYAIVSTATANTNGSPNLVNCDLWKINAVLPVGGQAGYVPVWNPATQKLQVFADGITALGPAPEVLAATDLSAYAFQLLLLGL